MTNLNALYVSLESVKNDPALSAGNRGARKLLVTTLFGNEEEASEPIWKPSDPCQVLLMSKTESAVFNNLCRQDRHYHKEGIEIYSVIEGRMQMEVDDRLYELAAGDMIVVLPGAKHLVKQSKECFLCRVLTVDCAGEEDKYKV